jgi:PadR family transcriptional regulator, regulatory protein PadR
MSRIRRPSAQTAAVMLALGEEPAVWRYGYELCQQLGIQAGSMYPILMRLADRGLLDTTWETDSKPGRPPRHLYRLTDKGLSFASRLAAETATSQGAEAPHAAVARPIVRTPRLTGGQP